MPVRLYGIVEETTSRTSEQEVALLQAQGCQSRPEYPSLGDAFPLDQELFHRRVHDIALYDGRSVKQMVHDSDDTTVFACNVPTCDFHLKFRRRQRIHKVEGFIPHSCQLKEHNKFPVASKEYFAHLLRNETLPSKYRGKECVEFCNTLADRMGIDLHTMERREPIVQLIFERKHPPPKLSNEQNGKRQIKVDTSKQQNNSATEMSSLNDGKRAALKLGSSSVRLYGSTLTDKISRSFEQERQLLCALDRKSRPEYPCIGDGLNFDESELRREMEVLSVFEGRLMLPVVTSNGIDFTCRVSSCQFRLMTRRRTIKHIRESFVVTGFIHHTCELRNHANFSTLTEEQIASIMKGETVPSRYRGKEFVNFCRRIGEKYGLDLTSLERRMAISKVLRNYGLIEQGCLNTAKDINSARNRSRRETESQAVDFNTPRKKSKLYKSTNIIGTTHMRSFAVKSHPLPQSGDFSTTSLTHSPQLTFDQPYRVTPSSEEFSETPKRPLTRSKNPRMETVKHLSEMKPSTNDLVFDIAANFTGHRYCQIETVQSKRISNSNQNDSFGRRILASRAQPNQLNEREHIRRESSGRKHASRAHATFVNREIFSGRTPFANENDVENSSGLYSSSLFQGYHTNVVQGLVEKVDFGPNLSSAINSIDRKLRTIDRTLTKLFPGEVSKERSDFCSEIRLLNTSQTRILSELAHREAQMRQQEEDDERKNKDELRVQKFLYPTKAKKEKTEEISVQAYRIIFSKETRFSKANQSGPSLKNTVIKPTLAPLPLCRRINIYELVQPESFTDDIENFVRMKRTYLALSELKHSIQFLGKSPV